MVDVNNFSEELKGGGAIIAILGLIFLLVGWFLTDFKSFLLAYIIGGVLVGIGVSAIIIGFEIKGTPNQ